MYINYIFNLFIEKMADFKLIWSNCLKVIKDNIDDHSFMTWFVPIKPEA